MLMWFCVENSHDYFVPFTFIYLFASTAVCPPLTNDWGDDGELKKDEKNRENLMRYFFDYIKLTADI